MTKECIETEFRQKVAAEIRIAPEGVDRYRIFTPFQFDDGDRFSIVLKREKTQWLLSDEAHTYMQMSYDIDVDELYKGRRKALITKALTMFGVQDRNGELVIDVAKRDYGECLYSFVQALLKSETRRANTPLIAGSTGRIRHLSCMPFPVMAVPATRQSRC